MAQKEEITSYLQKVVKIRKRLFDDNKSQNTTLQSVADYEHIKVNLEANKKRFTNQGIAKFFLRNERRILNIIPGRESRNHKKLMKEFHRIKFHCESIADRDVAVQRLNGKDKALPCLNDKALPRLNDKALPCLNDKAPPCLNSKTWAL
jgi:negative regulator of sigma E activity